MKQSSFIQAKQRWLRYVLLGCGSVIGALTLAGEVRADVVVNDVTKLNPIRVDRVIHPTTKREIAEAVRAHPGPISVAGGRYSMGGQTACEGALQIDLRDFNQVVAFSPTEKVITVQTGMQWREVQSFIDRHNLAVQIMQTYANFTVGGSLSVNAHGRYIGRGPLIRSVRSIRVILADGSEKLASPTENPDLFYGAIGGYGALGVIVEATLNLDDNEKITCDVVRVPTRDYRSFFTKTIRDDRSVVFHNGDLYPPNFEVVRSETWKKTDLPLTVKERLRPRGQKYWLMPNTISAISILPFGRELRADLLDPLRDRIPIVCWRNYEASYDVAMLEPTTPRILWSYVLQEYFVPVSKFRAFVDQMRDTFSKHNVNVINVSIRHALPDPGSLLAWAPEEVFSFVVYYKQSTLPVERERTAVWTRELIDRAIALKGRYYLPYQVLATPEQFAKAYPRQEAFFALKQRLDPTGKFQNVLLLTYEPEPVDRS